MPLEYRKSLSDHFSADRNRNVPIAMRRELYAEMSTGLSLHNPRKSVRLPRSKVRSCMRRTKSDDAYSVVRDFLQVLLVLRTCVADSKGFFDNKATKAVRNPYDWAVFSVGLLSFPRCFIQEALCVFPQAVLTRPPQDTDRVCVISKGQDSDIINIFGDMCRPEEALLVLSPGFTWMSHQAVDTDYVNSVAGCSWPNIAETISLDCVPLEAESARVKHLTWARSLRNAVVVRIFFARRLFFETCQAVKAS
jgi:hypothetical protein